MSRLSPSSRGTVSLVALCFVAVLGISLASYLTICTRSMQLSNRSYQSGLGQQLAELGLEEGLRAFNKGDWGGWSSNPSGITGATAAWTLDTTNKRASRTLTFDSTRLGQNVTATVKIRIDNYDANVLGSDYNASTTYRIGDLVGSGGIWYRCVANNSGQTPSGIAKLAYWVPEQIPWMWQPNYSYRLYDVVNYQGTWYRCTSGHTSGALWSGTNWTSIANIRLYNGGNFHSTGDIVYAPGANTWWICSSSGTPGSFNTTAQISWQWLASSTYYFNDVVCYYNGSSYMWYRCKSASVFSSTAPNSDTTNWENALSGTMSNWSSANINYNVGDCVYYSTNSQWYRCIRAHSSSSYNPTNTTYWATTPALSQDWQPNHQYSSGDVVRYKGTWYLSLSSSNNFGRIPTDASSGYWAAAPQSLQVWNSATYYEVDDLVSNSGTWYRCIKPHKNQTPPNTTYWTVLTGSGSSYVWDAGTAYAAGSYRSYGGVWYKCITATAANDGRDPNDSGYWTPTWAQPSNTSIVTGAPVVYAESTITIAGSPPIRTQIRAPIAPAPLFPNAVGSTTTVNLGSGGTVDSYDGSVRSVNPNNTTSTFTYNDQTNSPFSSTNPNIGFTATLAATGSTSPALTITSTTVKGFAAASPASVAPFAPLASYGTSAWLLNSDSTAISADTTATNVDLARISRSPYVPQFATLPSGGMTAAFSAGTVPRGLLLVEPSGTGNTVSIGTPGAVTPSIYYYAGNLTISDTSSIRTLIVEGPVILYINGDLTLDGDGSAPDGSINITSTGSAEIHVADSVEVLQNSDGIRNTTLDPKKLIVISDATSSSVQSYGDGGYPFYGTVYMPNTTTSLGLNFNNSIVPASATCAVYGALSAKEVTYTNDSNVHYDTSLRYATFGGVEQPYTVTQWRELPQTEQATMP